LGYGYWLGSGQSLQQPMTTITLTETQMCRHTMCIVHNGHLTSKQSPNSLHPHPLMSYWLSVMSAVVCH